MAVNAQTTCASIACRISSLNNFAIHNTMELAIFVMVEISFLTSTQLSEIFCGLWHHLCQHFEHYPACCVPFISFSAYGYIKVALRIFRVEVFQVRMVLRLFRFIFLLSIHSFLEETLDNRLFGNTLCFLCLFDCY